MTDQEQKIRELERERDRFQQQCVYLESRLQEAEQEVRRLTLLTENMLAHQLKLIPALQTCVAVLVDGEGIGGSFALWRDWYTCEAKEAIQAGQEALRLVAREEAKPCP